MRLLTCTKKVWSAKIKKFPTDIPENWSHHLVNPSYRELLRTYGLPEEGDARHAIWYFLVPVPGLDDKNPLVPARLMNVFPHRRTKIRSWLFSFPVIFKKVETPTLTWEFQPLDHKPVLEWMRQDIIEENAKPKK